MKAGRTGYTTGTCAAAAAKAAAMMLSGAAAPAEVEVYLPSGERVRLPLEYCRGGSDSATAAVKKDAGDDPDVTDGCTVIAEVALSTDADFTILAGSGVGTVTKPGLAQPPGEPAINPVPRRMIQAAVREVIGLPVSVTISIPGGEELAAKTFNPRLGVVGGLSILGTSGIVRPFSTKALRDALECSLSVAVACKVRNPVIVPGRIGEKAARSLFRCDPEHIIEAGNEWGFILDRMTGLPFDRLLIVGHPGKLAKLINNEWDTHSSRSAGAVPVVEEIQSAVLGRESAGAATVEGLFAALDTEDRTVLANHVAAKIRDAVAARTGHRFSIAVVLVTLTGALLGSAGDLSAWR